VNNITDMNGKEMMMQKLSDGSIAFFAENIPSFGGKRFLLNSATSKLPPFHPMNNVTGGYANKYFQISIDNNNGSISSLKLLPENIELVDKKSYSGLNQYLYVAGLDPEKATTITNASISMKESGPLFTTFTIKSTAPGCNSYHSEITVYENEKRIDISNTMDKISVRDKESVHAAFPFLLPESENRFNTGWNGIFEPGKNQLKGANQDYYCVQNWLDISNAKVGVTMLLLDANLVEQGSMLSEVKGKFGVKDWKTEPTPGSTVFSYVLNNYWHTNFKADQGGKINVRDTLLPHYAFNMLETQRAGIAYSSPLLVVNAGKPDLPASLFQLSDPNIIATSIEPDGGHYKIRMFNISDKNVSCRVLWNSIKPEKIKVFYDGVSYETKNANEAIDFPALGIIEIVTE
jgi:alpha-mannosidase